MMAMDTEEMLRAQPMDAVVLIGGCDKTVPAQLMGAASAGLPAIQLLTGSMLTGSHRGERVGACTDCRRTWGRFRAGEIDEQETAEVNNQLVASVGTCSVMGTASTMACIAEALGMTVPGGASPPAVTANRIRIAERTGAQAVQLARERLTIDKILTPAAFENAMRVLLAIGPKGAPGMPEAGAFPIPRKLARDGVKDLVRISDGRMSGTAFGTIVLHVTPEAAVGGPLSLVRNGDRIRLSVAARELSLLVPQAELARRAKAQPASEPTAERGYRKLYLQCVLRADQGVDFDFLRAVHKVGKVPGPR
jgi:dihydroxyacid dehydratase/phosphogluconate dehydratase